MSKEPLLPIQYSDTLTTGATFALIFEWLLPQIFNDLGIDAGNTNNAYLLSHLSPREDSEAASAIISTTQVAIVVIPSSFLYMLPVLIKYHMPDNKPAAITSGILFGLMLSIPGVIFGFMTGRFFSAIGVKPEVTHLVNEYFSIFSFALPLWMVATSLSKVASPLGDKYLMYPEALINFLCVTGFSQFFVNVYSLPDISPIQTLALSNVVCAGTRILYYLIAYTRLKKFESLEAMCFETYKRAILFLIETGFKLCVQLSSELFALYFLPILTVLFLQSHLMNLSVLNVMSQCFVFSMIITLSMAITAMHLVNDCRENKEFKNVSACVNTMLVLSFVYNSFLFIIMMSETNGVVNFFMNPQGNTNNGLSGDFKMMFLISYLGLVFNAFKDIINMSQRALGVFSLPMKVSLGGVWGVGIPLAILLATCTDLGVGGLWLGYNIGNVVTGLFLLAHWCLISQSDVIEEIFSGQTNKSEEVDQISYCFRSCKALFYAECCSGNSGYSLLANKY